MTNKKIVIHNTESGEVIEREMNAEELTQWEESQAVFAAQLQAQAEAAAAKAALLERLGITEEEAKLLLS
jgi:hypothetical protein